MSWIKVNQKHWLNPIYIYYFYEFGKAGREFLRFFIHYQSTFIND